MSLENIKLIHKCLTCGKIFYSWQESANHAKETGHVDLELIRIKAKSESHEVHSQDI